MSHTILSEVAIDITLKAGGMGVKVSLLWE
jgi:hypothetical protein